MRPALWLGELESNLNGLIAIAVLPFDSSFEDAVAALHPAKCKKQLAATWIQELCKAIVSNPWYCERRSTFLKNCVTTRENAVWWVASKMNLNNANVRLLVTPPGLYCWETWWLSWGWCEGRSLLMS